MAKHATMLKAMSKQRLKNMPIGLSIDILASQDFTKGRLFNILIA